MKPKICFLIVISVICFLLTPMIAVNAEQNGERIGIQLTKETPIKAPPIQLKTDTEKAIYTFGQLIAIEAESHQLTDSELKIFETGFLDCINGRSEDPIMDKEHMQIMETLRKRDVRQNNKNPD